VVGFAKGATGNANPIVTLQGASTGLSGPIGIACNSAGNMFITNNSDGSVTEYATGANGNAAPIATISGPATRLRSPAAVALDSAGNLYVTTAGYVTKYAAGANGNAPPVAAISGLGLAPSAVPLDSAGTCTSPTPTTR
jgi:hypothetical protein